MLDITAQLVNLLRGTDVSVSRLSTQNCQSEAIARSMRRNLESLTENHPLETIGYLQQAGRSDWHRRFLSRLQLRCSVHLGYLSHLDLSTSGFLSTDHDPYTVNVHRLDAVILPSGLTVIHHALSAI